MTHLLLMPAPVPDTDIERVDAGTPDACGCPRTLLARPDGLPVIGALALWTNHTSACPADNDMNAAADVTAMYAALETTQRVAVERDKQIVTGLVLAQSLLGKNITGLTEYGRAELDRSRVALRNTLDDQQCFLDVAHRRRTLAAAQRS